MSAELTTFQGGRPPRRRLTPRPLYEPRTGNDIDVYVEDWCCNRLDRVLTPSQQVVLTMLIAAPLDLAETVIEMEDAAGKRLLYQRHWFAFGHEKDTGDAVIFEITAEDDRPGKGKLNPWTKSATEGASSGLVREIIQRLFDLIRGSHLDTTRVTGRACAEGQGSVFIDDLQVVEHARLAGGHAVEAVGGGAAARLSHTAPAHGEFDCDLLLSALQLESLFADAFDAFLTDEVHNGITAVGADATQRLVPTLAARAFLQGWAEPLNGRAGVLIHAGPAHTPTVRADAAVMQPQRVRPSRVVVLVSHHDVALELPKTAVPEYLYGFVVDSRAADATQAQWHAGLRLDVGTVLNKIHMTHGNVRRGCEPRLGGWGEDALRIDDIGYEAAWTGGGGGLDARKHVDPLDVPQGLTRPARGRAGVAPNRTTNGGASDRPDAGRKATASCNGQPLGQNLAVIAILRDTDNADLGTRGTARSTAVNVVSGTATRGRVAPPGRADIHIVFGLDLEIVMDRPQANALSTSGDGSFEAVFLQWREMSDDLKSFTERFLRAMADMRSRKTGAGKMRLIATDTLADMDVADQQLLDRVLRAIAAKVGIDLEQNLTEGNPDWVEAIRLLAALLRADPEQVRHELAALQAQHFEGKDE
jgi:hypothetical protein